MQDRFEKFSMFTSNIRRAMRKIKMEELAEFDLKPTQLSCVYSLYKFGPLTATELSDICKEDKGALSRSIEQLIDRGFITYDQSTQKRYRSPLMLTNHGRSVAEKLVAKINDMIEAAGAGVSEEDREIFYRTLATISENLENICKNYN